MQPPEADKDGYLDISDRPALGVELNEEVCREHICVPFASRTTSRAVFRLRSGAFDFPAKGVKVDLGPEIQIEFSGR